MIIPEIKSIMSADIPYGTLPPDPEDCRVGIQVSIGTKGSPGADIFSFDVVTPRCLDREPATQWGRGLLIVREFSWATVEHSLQRLLAHAHRKTWIEIATELNKELHWEFEKYQEYKT